MSHKLKSLVACQLDVSAGQFNLTIIGGSVFELFQNVLQIGLHHHLLIKFALWLI